MAYVPDMRDYQQIALGGSSGPYDCTAWCGALLVDVHTQGKTKTTGRAVRLNSSEPVPDPKRSPGLNLQQVDGSVINITNGHVLLDTKVQNEALTRVQFKNRIIDGRWGAIQVDRGVLVNRGFVNGFTGDHAITLHTASDPEVPILGDPLITSYVRLSWDAVLDAANVFALRAGYGSEEVLSQFTRDLTPDFRIRIVPTAPAKAVKFIRFFVNSSGQIVRRKQHITGGTRQPCSPPVWYSSKIPGVPGRRLVTIMAGKFEGFRVDARYAHEVYP